jgi:hypothetical protein
MFRILVGPHRTPSRVHTREYYEQGECLQGLPGERGIVVRFASPCPPVSRMHSLTTMDDPGDEGWGFSNQRAADALSRRGSPKSATGSAHAWREAGRSGRERRVSARWDGLTLEARQTVAPPAEVAHVGAARVREARGGPWWGFRAQRGQRTSTSGAAPGR